MGQVEYGIMEVFAQAVSMERMTFVETVSLARRKLASLAIRAQRPARLAVLAERKFNTVPIAEDSWTRWQRLALQISFAEMGALIARNATADSNMDKLVQQIPIVRMYEILPEQRLLVPRLQRRKFAMTVH